MQLDLALDEPFLFLMDDSSHVDEDQLHLEPLALLVELERFEHLLIKVPLEAERVLPLSDEATLHAFPEDLFGGVPFDFNLEPGLIEHLEGLFALLAIEERVEASEAPFLAIEDFSAQVALVSNDLLS